ncbi:alpha/beta fold hydrolase [Actinopolymorpha rutila]|uniref:Pimeloyl-ACP methyl ester carboxylesterase n=1 Tax=Actinopolymorpha rutila TaxID=446787 RepID=A0A852ZLV7_9ACTN|nr:pimeloyl-ACP methyl ester carboxylesterase [Actinopolymorpha rutila]
MQRSMQRKQREAVRFASGDADCAAWFYPGRNGACVIMTGGFGVTKEPGTDLFAGRFHDAGFGVLAFDYRNFGESGGGPRQVARISEQLADWSAAIEFAGTLPGVDRDRIALWAFSISSGHVLRAAARHPEVAGAIAQMPYVDGPAGFRVARRHQTASAMARLFGRALLDAAGGLFGRPPRLVPLSGPPGTVALLTTPDTQDGDRALNPGNRYPEWQQAAAARSVLGAGSYRPGRDAPKVRCPLLMVVCDQDQSVPVEAAVRVAQQAPRGELVRLPGGHYAPFLEAHDQAVDAELAFLRRHLLGAEATTSADNQPLTEPDARPAT